MMVLNENDNTMTVTLARADYDQMMVYLDKYRSIFFDVPATHEKIVDLLGKLSWHQNCLKETATVIKQEKTA
jgi:hypothetical protein